jgi:DNA-binding transcriptional MerR regulator
VSDSHHSIGEVLSLLKEEHPDVTIAKIRFLESQGLIEPERTPSGYRKFYDADIDRLRWILTQQSDNFLPLKVIRRRLEEAGFDPASELFPRGQDQLPEPTLFRQTDGESEPELDSMADTIIDLSEARIIPTPSTQMTGLSGDAPLDTPGGSVSMTAGELADAVGTEIGYINELHRLGLIESVEMNGVSAFDHEALLVSKAAVRFKAYGLETRHLRMFKVAAERETGMLQQILGARLLRGGEARTAARDDLNELVRLGETIQRSILRRGIGESID